MRLSWGFVEGLERFTPRNPLETPSEPPLYIEQITVILFRVPCSMFEGFERFERFERFEGFEGFESLKSLKATTK
jgi:hypothetical protein